MHSIYKLEGQAQHYTWGGKEFIPLLLNKANLEDKPFAEYWLGAHPNCSSTLVNGEAISLCKAIEENAEKILGKKVMEQFGSLPYLFKILDVQQMLSIQVHPSKQAAAIGYADENEKGVALTAPNRNYKDQNHKPELMVALSDFWLLHGFKNEQKLTRIFAEVAALSFLKKDFEQNGYEGLYQRVMTMPQAKVDEVLQPLMNEIIPLYQQQKLDRSSEHFWAARAALSFCKNDCFDRGIFSIYFFNLLHLKIGEGIYQADGLPHAYLEGQNVEVMANSDNVLRAGLTDKHIDVAELMKHVKFVATEPQIIAVANGEEQFFTSPAKEFLLAKYQLNKPIKRLANTATILFVYNGGVAVSVEEREIQLKAGEAALILADKEFWVTPITSATFFTVTTPVDKK